MPPKHAQTHRRGRSDEAARTTGSSVGRDRTAAARPTGSRPSPGQGSGAGGGGPAGRQVPGQVDVRRMISQLNRDGSPTKRQREASLSSGPSEADADDPCADEQMATFTTIIQRELKKQTSLITLQFQRTTDALKEEMLAMQRRICDLEQHVNEQTSTIQQLYEAVDSRDTRISELEGEMEEMRRESNCAYLTFNGPGVPAPPSEEPWKEEVEATTRTMLQKYMPEVEVKNEDVAQCYRVDRGRAIVCQFTRWGQGSVRDKIYDNRMNLAKDRDGQSRGPTEQLFVNERLTPGAKAAFFKLREEKKRGRLHSVYTKHGIIFVRTKQHGAKVRVYNRETCERVLRGEC